MSTIRLPVPYRIETISPAAALVADRRSRGGTATRPEAARAEPGKPVPAPTRAAPFITQLMTDLAPELRMALGRRDMADLREAAYGAALGNRPSRRAARPVLADCA